ncbi:pancreatic secretory granule membrane major glycoprotein GP2-like isoform X2 [Ruditapes philippinarum]|uniref:pancreatic secretory granule membrane major glycoprotein GP2-like isoform X2 n=1 Tax=Ruditapes philippinarum TaxID=129788 RepID=UPI00295BBF20|nr:pancreatic secretory granule membrane major glycoprotein GP2-like isoform X2 [Ruditapes philippinarum]
MALFLLLCLCCLLKAGNAGLCDATDFDPCLFKNNLNIVPYLNTRHPSVDFSRTTDDTKYCDLFALDHGKWYWSSYNMTNYCVDHRKCGTNDPIYLNGSIPSPEDNVIDATACVRTFGNCCAKTLNLRLKNCWDFMVYCFPDLESSCHSRFCFDSDSWEDRRDVYTDKQNGTCRTSWVKIALIVWFFVSLAVIIIVFVISSIVYRKSKGFIHGKDEQTNKLTMLTP